MKVIQDNRVRSRFTFPFRITCGRCKSELQVDSNDDIKEASGSEMQGTNSHMYVRCPLCHFHNSVRAPHIPTAEDYYNK